MLRRRDLYHVPAGIGNCEAAFWGFAELGGVSSFVKMAHAVPPPPPPENHYLDAARATADDVIADLRTYGFSIVCNVLSAAEAAEKRTELTGILDRTATPAGRNAFEGFSTRRLYALFGKTRCFDAPALHPLALGVAKGILGEHLQLNSVVGIEIRPGERAQGLHRDEAKYPPHALPGFPEVIVNSMWALTEFTPEMAPLWCCQGRISARVKTLRARIQWQCR